MCGILGAINNTFDHSILDTIAHRGPDFGNIIEYEVDKSSICFGHRRLSIVDLSPTGNQPMEIQNGQYSIIFNGEIYNHQDLRQKIKDVDFKGHSDTETIINHIAQNGIESVADLNGIFAIAFLDKTNKKLYLVRDRFGVKPLYYHHDASQNKLIFSSEIRPLRKIIESQLDKENLAQLLKLRYNPAPQTLYSDIHKLRPGHILEYDLSTHKIKFTSFIKNVSINRNSTFNKAIDKYGVLFENAIKRQLMADVEIGSLLSGGVDSALVTYFAQKHSNYKLKTFTVGFQDRDAVNELDYAGESAGILGTDHKEIVITKDDFRQALEQVCNIVEEPLGTTSVIPMYFLNQEVSKHLKVVLTGQGADEPLGGYTRYKGEIYRNYIPKSFFSLAQPFTGYIKNEQLMRSVNSLGEADIIKRFEKIYAVFTDAEINKLIGITDSKSYSSIQYFYDLLNCKSKEGVEAMMAIDLRMNLADDLLIYTDKISMNFGLETRVPLLDNELIEFIESLPYSYRIHKGVGKFIHKEFAKSVLPKTIVDRKKLGFQSPTNAWFKGDLGDHYMNEFSNSNSEFFNVFRKDEVLNLFHLHKNGVNKEKQIFLILSLYYWFKNI